tara:strand:+ start:2291 stop:2599 length:309 start_codon:yes stop_codon:yes gene_type:complete
MKIVFTYISDEQKAEGMINILLQEKLAACISTFPCKSRYWWKNKIEKNDNEIVVWIKTKDNLVEEVMERVKQLHPYELPAIDVVDVEKMNSGSETWINEVTK